MIIAAISDVHSPRYYDQYVEAIGKLNVKPDLFLIAGDMIYHGSFEEYQKVYNVLFGKINCPIVACFGNQEFPEIREKIKESLKEIRFLDDQSIVLQIAGNTVGIFGSTGSLDTPTKWQKANIPNIEKIYAQRIELAEKQLERMHTDLKILLLHYAPTYKTLEGENPNFYPFLGSQVFENVIIKTKPSLVVHGHSHLGTKKAWVDTVPVFNVSLTVNKEVVIINTEEDLKPGLQKFV
jgi:Icc-related predicted phosphoesterase